MMEETIKWLLEGEPWVEYRTRVDLLGQSENEAEVLRARNAMINHPRIQSLLDELKNWSGMVISSHKSAGQPFHKLSFIADLGLTKDDPPINEIIKKIYEHRSMKGPFNSQRMFQSILVAPVVRNGRGRSVMLPSSCIPWLSLVLAKMSKSKKQ